MRAIIDAYKETGNLHHAYALEGQADVVLKELLNFLEKDLKQNIKANPDIWHEKFETLTIDDARKLQEKHAVKAFSEKALKIFIIETSFITVEAQNSLLKLFEEPSEHAHFFIILPSAEILLPTVRSRLMIIRNQDQAENFGAFSDINIKVFLASSVSERLKIVGDIIEEKDKIKAIAFIDVLLRYLHQEKEVLDMPEVFAELARCRMYLNDRSPSVKLLLEHAAIIVPRFS